MLTTDTGVTRRQMLVAGGTFAGYALGVEKVLAQAIKTDTDGLVAGDQQVTVGGVKVPVYEARPATGKDTPIVLVISEIWGVHEYIKDTTRRFAKAGFYAVAPELFVREGGVAHLTEHPGRSSRSSSARSASRRSATSRPPSTGPRRGPNVKADRVGVTGWCWGGSTTMQVAGTQPRREGGGRLVRPAVPSLPGRQRSR